MFKLLQINTTCNSASHGRIAEQIGLKVIEQGGESYIAYGRGNPQSRSNTYKVCNTFTFYKNTFLARIFDNDGFCSGNDTIKLIDYIEKINPDLIHLHNLHGYYLNIETLLVYVKSKKIPVVWTLHDCWTITGHCCHFESVGCNKWQNTCYDCPKKKSYPSSYIFDRSKLNHKLKKLNFIGLDNLVLVTPSNWLHNILSKSFLGKYHKMMIHNGVDINVFKYSPDDNQLKKYDLIGKKIILGVPSNLTSTQCVDEFIQLSYMLPDCYRIILIGVPQKKLKTLPANIIGIEFTSSITEMVSWYSNADVFVNVTKEDTFPTTNIEALACGTPVITYDTGGSVEAVSEGTGYVVEHNDLKSMIMYIDEIIHNGKPYYLNACRMRVLNYFVDSDRYNDYLSLYQELIATSPNHSHNTQRDRY